MDVRIGGAWVSPSTAEAYAAGAWRTLRYGEAYFNGSWRQIVSFVQTLVLAISPSPTGTHSNSSDTMTTATITATPTGGLGPFTYAWTTLLTNGLTGVTINSPTSAATTFTATVGGAGESGTATFRCTATDALGSTDTADVEVTFNHISFGGP